jgi:hypothetical protein
MWPVKAAALMLCLGWPAAVAGQTPVIDAAPVMDAALPDFGLQRLIDALGEDGGEIRLPTGRFELRRSIMLRSKVRIRGVSPTETILTLRNLERTMPFVTVAPNQLRVDVVPENLRIGATIYVWPSASRANTYGGAVLAHLVTGIDGLVITVDQPLRKMPSGFLSSGQSSLLTEPCSAGAQSLAVADSSLFRPGDAVVVGSGDGNANESLSFIRDIQGNTLLLERPIRQEHPFQETGYWRRPAVWALFPLVTAETVSGAAVCDLALEHPFPLDERPKMRQYTVSPIHLFNASDTLLQNLHVHNSLTDGISLQTGNRNVVRSCRVWDCHGSGLHPGTSLQESLFEDNILENNGSGLYFCWNNRGHVLRRNRFLGNGVGISGLGNPSDTQNTIEDNVFARNRREAIQINGGRQSGNVIQRNRFEDNSAAEPGKHAAILIHAMVEDATGYVIESNLFINSVEPGSQTFGVEERYGNYRGTPTLANGNVIRDNAFVRMRVADILHAGPSTRIDQPEARIQQAAPSSQP